MRRTRLPKENLAETACSCRLLLVQRLAPAPAEGVNADRDDQNDAGSDVLRAGWRTQKVESVSDTPNHQRAENCVVDTSAATKQAGAADDRGGDCIE